uniref:Uncharacterized protein n=1 Tax=Rhizophora mucronata TaxID=61149 RepID=A0A2P2NUX8_RHIMU
MKLKFFMIHKMLSALF